MTVLYDPGRRTVYTDEACFPLQFADHEASDPSADLHTLIAAMVALHGGWAIDDDVCTECRQPAPCKSLRLATALEKAGKWR